MRFKLILVFVEDSKTDLVLDTSREYGATGATVINNARGEGIIESIAFLGLTLDTQRDVVLLLVEEHLSRTILEAIASVVDFDTRPGTGIAFQINVEDAVGVRHQIQELTHVVDDEL